MFRRFLLCWLTLLLVGAGLAALASGADAPRDCTKPPARGQIGGSPGTDILTLGDDDLRRILVAARDAGMSAIRVDIDWSKVEPQQGHQDWSVVDRAVNAVQAAGMCPLGLITYAPAWAADPADKPSGHYFAPQDPGMFGAFSGIAANRYRDSVAVWEVWNEPNTVNYFKPAPDPARYVHILAAAYTAIKAVRPSLTVLSGGLAPAEDNGSDIAPRTFLLGLYAAGGNKYFDGFAIHPYSYPALPDDPNSSDWNTALHVSSMRDIMVAGGDSAKPIWITECGAPTGTSPKAVSDADQAQTIRTVLRAARDIGWLGPAFVYSIRDSGTDAADPEQNFGILRHDFSTKPAYDVVREFTGGDR